MGFPTKITNTIMLCISIVNFPILINGEPMKTTYPIRGIRQGNLLSPYLYILCVDFLSNMINQPQLRNDICGIYIAKNAPKTTHLLFANDNLIFCMEKEKDIMNLVNILNIYQEASG